MEMDRYIGRLLDNRYEILEVIGTGGMAVVYKALCHRLNRMVAIKILKDDLSQEAEFRTRFHAESQAVAMLSHPNIVSVYDVSTTDDADYIVMELIDGMSLKEYMEKRGVLNWKETLHYATQIAKALEHAHSRGIIHRDIKPHNVMLLRNGSVKVADFGIARVMSKSNTLTKEALGSVHYISPEQAKGGRVDNRSDLYSLGVVMYEMMTGRPPYDGESPVAVAIQHINGKAAMPSSINPNIPGGLEQIIMRAMAQSPADRFATCSEMLRDMDAFRQDATILFDYNNPTSDMDAAVKLQNAAQEQKETAPLPKTAERVAGAAVPAKQRPVQSAPKKKKPSGKSGSRRRREVIVEDDDDRSKFTTIAVAICAVVAVIAIAVLGVAIFNMIGDNMVSVPNLQGLTLDEALELGTVQIKVSERKNSTEFPAGQIISQNPLANTQIAKGGVVTVVVSLGAEQQSGTMDDLVGSKLEDAQAFLDGQGLHLNILPRYETHSTIESGKITRTEPAQGEALTEGQTVYLWVSTGPEAREELVPNVKGMTLDMAVKILNNNGFFNILYEPVESNKAKNTVVGQSLEPQIRVDVTTEITLQYSDGEGEPEKPVGPTEPVVDPDLVTTVITVTLPENTKEDYVLEVWHDGKVVQEIEIYAGAISVQVELEGKNVMKFEFKVDGKVIKTEIIDFDENAPMIPENASDEQADE